MKAFIGLALLEASREHLPTSRKLSESINALSRALTANAEIEQDPDLATALDVFYMQERKVPLFNPRAILESEDSWRALQGRELTSPDDRIMAALSVERGNADVRRYLRQELGQLFDDCHKSEKLAQIVDHYMAASIGASVSGNIDPAQPAPSQQAALIALQNQSFLALQRQWASPARLRMATIPRSAVPFANAIAGTRATTAKLTVAAVAPVDVTSAIINKIVSNGQASVTQTQLVGDLRKVATAGVDSAANAADVINDIDTGTAVAATTVANIVSAGTADGEQLAALGDMASEIAPTVLGPFASSLSDGLDSITDAVTDFASDALSGVVGELGTGLLTTALTGGIATIATGLLGSLGGGLFGGGGDQGTKEAIHELTVHIDQLVSKLDAHLDRIDAELRAGFDEVDGKLDKISADLAQLHVDLTAVRKDVDDLTVRTAQLQDEVYQLGASLREQNAALYRQQFLGAIQDVLSARPNRNALPNTTDTHLDDGLFTQYEQGLYNYLTTSLTAGSPVVSDPTVPGESGPGSFRPISDILNGSLPYALNFLAQYAGTFPSSTALSASTVINSHDYAVGLAAYVRLLEDWPDNANKLGADHLRQLISLGTSLRVALRAIPETYDDTSATSPLFEGLLAKHASDLQKVEADIQTISNTTIDSSFPNARPGRRAALHTLNVYGDHTQTISPPTDLPIKDCGAVTFGAAPGGAPRQGPAISLDAPPSMWAFVPQEVIILDAMAVDGFLYSCLFAFPDGAARHIAGGYDTDYRDYANPGPALGFDRIVFSPPGFIDGSKVDANNNDNNFVPDAQYVVENWHAGDNFFARLDALNATYPSYWKSWFTTSTPGWDAKIDAHLQALRQPFHNAVLAAVTAEPLSDDLAAVSTDVALLQAYAEAGLPDVVQTDDALRAALYEPHLLTTSTVQSAYHQAAASGPAGMVDLNSAESNSISDLRQALYPAMKKDKASNGNFIYPALDEALSLAQSYMSVAAP